MADLTIFVLKYCGFCRRALSWLDEIRDKNPEFQKLEIELVDEGIERERARKLDYYYVPTFYIGERKVHEGAVNRNKVEAILNEALKAGGRER